MKIKTKIFRVFKNGRFQFRSTKLIVFAFMVIVGCKDANEADRQISSGNHRGIMIITEHLDTDTIHNVTIGYKAIGVMSERDKKLADSLKKGIMGILADPLYRVRPNRVHLL